MNGQKASNWDFAWDHQNDWAGLDWQIIIFIWIHYFPLSLTVCHFTFGAQKLRLYTSAETHVIYVSCDTYEENKMPQLLKQSNYPWFRTLLLSSLWWDGSGVVLKFFLFGSFLICVILGCSLDSFLACLINIPCTQSVLGSFSCKFLTN